MKKAISLILTVIMLFSIVSVSVSAQGTGDYTIESPYADVIWDGEDAWGAYKGNLHTHTYASDADVDLRDMILEYYNQGYDFLAITDHAVTGVEWNEKPAMLPLYLYQGLIGNVVHCLSDEEYAAVTDGTYPVDGTARGTGMVCVPYGNELNGLTLTKCHVNAFFNSSDVGNNHLGYENDHEGAVKLAQEANAMCFINHPGDWLQSNGNKDAVNDEDNIDYFANIILGYDNCLGIEVFNEKNSVTPYDRTLWDNLLMKCLPYGKTVIGFSNSDAHYLYHVDSSFSVFMMEENTLDNIKATMQSGAFFMVTRNICADEELGPDEDMCVRNGGDDDHPNAGYAYPEFTKVAVDGHKVTIKFKNAYDVRWVANGKVIDKYTCDQSEDETTYVIDLDQIDGAEDFLYIRCQLIGEGGVTLTQALTIEDGSEKLTYTKDTSAKATLSNIWYRIKSLRICVLVKIVIDAIADKFNG